MKTILCALFLAITLNAQATVMTATYTPTTPTTTTCDHYIIDLPSGTMVVLETAELVPSGQATIGQIIKFIVKTNVTVNRKVVITTGALAIGRVKSISPSSYNNPETIMIEITSVQAVDGQQVALNGNELMVKGMYPNQATEVPPGRPMTATVMNNIEIRVN